MQQRGNSKQQARTSRRLNDTGRVLPLTHAADVISERPRRIDDDVRVHLHGAPGLFIQDARPANSAGFRVAEEARDRRVVEHCCAVQRGRLRERERIPRVIELAVVVLNLQA